MKIDTYLETGLKRTFAGTLDWPGWSRSGRDEPSALQALLDYAPRYAAAIRSARLGFQPPADLKDFAIVERIEGDTTTDFGSPGRIPSADAAPLDDAGLRRQRAVLQACWRTFEAAAGKAKGKKLRPGPRGGGRDLQKLAGHVWEAHAYYIRALGWKSVLQVAAEVSAGGNAGALWQETVDALTASAHGELPARGPRGGLRWPARYFVRRAAWHLLDHAWEIEDRVG